GRGEVEGVVRVVREGVAVVVDAVADLVGAGEDGGGGVVAVGGEVLVHEAGARGRAGRALRGGAHAAEAVAVAVGDPPAGAGVLQVRRGVVAVAALAHVEPRRRAGQA